MQVSTSAVNALYEFGPFCLDPRKRVLLRHGEPVALTPKAFDTLLILVQNGGQPISRDDLMQAVWPDSFVEEGNLTQNIFVLRKALGSGNRYIVTIPGRGYQFVEPVQELEENPEGLAGTDSVSPRPEIKPGQNADNKAAERGWALRVYRGWPLFAGAIFIILLAVLFLRLIFQPHAPLAPGGKIMLAVIPFKSLNQDRGQDYFCDALTGKVIAQLGQINPDRLGVIARTAVAHYKHTQETPHQIARELGVQYVLEGSVRREAKELRVTVQLIQTKDQTRLWARQYDRELSSLLEVEDEIARQVTKEIRRSLGVQPRSDSAPASKIVLSRNTYEAEILYVRGLDFWDRRTSVGIERSVALFQQAIGTDPHYARAYAGLANSYVLMSGYNLVPPNEFMPKARAAALKALEIDPTLAEAHTALACIAQDYDWDWQTAESEYRRAIQLDPNYPTAHHWYAEYLALQGRFDEALDEIERARQLDPLSLIIAADKGAILYFSRQYDPAIRQFQAVLKIEPNFPRAHLLDLAYAQKGRFAEALDDIDKWRHIEDAPWSWMMLSYVYGRSGQPLQARRELQKLERLYTSQPMDPTPLIIAYIGIGDKDKAFHWLQRAYLEHSGVLITLKVDPAYDPLRSDPRFQDLLRRVGLAQEAGS